eukprot:215355_1
MASTFPKNSTIKALESEWKLLQQQRLILLLGHPKSGKSTILNSIFSDIEKQSQHINEDNDISQSDLASINSFISSECIASQYELDFAIITEYTKRSIYKHAAQNIKYFELFKDDWSNRKTIINNYAHTVTNYWHTKLNQHSEKSNHEYITELYNKLCSKFTMNDINNNRNKIVKDYTLLYAG